MSVRLLRGNFASVLGWALQDFEEISLGDITTSPFTFIGEEDVGGLSLDPAIFSSRIVAPADLPSFP